MKTVNFLDVCENQTRFGHKIYVPDYFESGKYPIVDQSRKFVVAYTNETEGLYTNVPIIIFGDVTRVFKYIDFPCFLGADGSVILKVINPLFITKYVYYSLLNSYIPDTGFNRHYKFLKDIRLKQYSLDEQKMIVKTLDDINLVISLENKRLSLLSDLIKSKFVEMFETIDLSEERDEWTELNKIATIYTGTTPSTNEPSNWNGDVLWITPAEMNDDTFFVCDTSRKLTEKGRKSKSLELMPVGTVLLSTRAPIGKVGIVGKPMACNQGFKNFKCDEKIVNSIYLYVLLKNNTQYLNSLGSGTTFLEVSKTNIGKMKIPLPDIKKQNEFANYVLKIVQTKQDIKKRISILTELLNKKMDEYFGGDD